jgi:hypothetical protein
MKKLAYFLIILVLSSLLTACGAKQKMEEKIAEKVIEQAIGNADIDIDGDEMTIKTEDGEITFGLTEWPDSQLCGRIPELKKGKISSAMNSEAYMLVIIEEVEEDDFMDYYNGIKGDFNQESYEAKSADSITYMGKSQEGISIMVSYEKGGKTATITASKEE